MIFFFLVEEEEYSYLVGYEPATCDLQYGIIFFIED
jgi:hypothetical protein